MGRVIEIVDKKISVSNKCRRSLRVVIIKRLQSLQSNYRTSGALTGENATLSGLREDSSSSKFKNLEGKL